MSKARTLNPYDMEERIHNLEENGGGGGGTTDGAKRADIATEFNTKTSYTAGNYVYHDGTLYIFNVDHASGEWDATDVSVANVTDEVTSNKAAIDALDGRVDDVESDIEDLPESVGNVRMTKLWENPDPTQAIVANTNITVNTAGYDFIMWIVAFSTTVQNIVTSAIVPNGKGFAPSISSVTQNSTAGRNIEYVDASTYVLKQAYNAGTANDAVGIPIAAYGIKLT